MNRFLVLSVVTFCLSAPGALAQTILPVNTGATSCLYERDGNDVCPTINPYTFPPCPRFSACEQVGDDLSWSCWNAEKQMPQSVGTVDLHTGGWATKWKGPPPGETGKRAVAVDFIVCGTVHACYCEISAEDGSASCESSITKIAGLDVYLNEGPPCPLVIIEGPIG